MPILHTLKNTAQRLCTLQNLIILTILFMLPLYASAAEPKDLLSGVEQDVMRNFGPGSKFMIILYLVEVVLGIAAYIKTKNLFSLIGIPVLVMFTAAVPLLIGS